MMKMTTTMTKTWRTWKSGCGLLSRRTGGNPEEAAAAALGEDEEAVTS